MFIGLPKEIQKEELRVALTPENVKDIVNAGHDVFVQKNAGFSSHFYDSDYEEAGAILKKTIEEVYENTDIIVKINEPLASEYDLLKNSQILFSFMNLEHNSELAKMLLKKNITAIDYNFVKTGDNKFPLLSPWNEITGKMAVQLGMNLSEYSSSENGIFLGNVTGLEPATIVIVGAGEIGIAAAKMASAIGSNVIILDNNIEKLNLISDIIGPNIKTIFLNTTSIEKHACCADLLICAFDNIDEFNYPIISENIVKNMKNNSAIIDLTIDKGGLVETIDRVTTIENPVFRKHGVLHYSATDIPNLVPKTSSVAFSNAILPYLLLLASKGFVNSAKKSLDLFNGVCTYNGSFTNQKLSDILNFDYTELSMLIGF